MTAENIFEHEKTPPTSLSMISSTAGNNVTKR
jgi:hypothetical protein